MSKYIIGVCGTHGTGKSTIVKSVREAGYPVMDVQLSRTAQAALGWSSLSLAQESIENMWDLQEAVLGAMWDRDQAITKSKTLTLVERTPADVWAYTQLWCQRVGVDVGSSRQALSYRQRCRDMACQYAKFICVPASDKVPFVEDPHRADLASRKYVESEIKRFISSGLLPAYDIVYDDQDERSAEVLGIFALHNALLNGEMNGN
jgi:predicted ATPase